MTIDASTSAVLIGAISAIGTAVTTIVVAYFNYRIKALETREAQMKLRIDRLQAKVEAGRREVT